MTIHFDEVRKTFLNSDFGPVPDGLPEVDEATYLACREGMGNGLVLTADSAGLPVLIPPPAMVPAELAAEQLRAINLAAAGVLSRLSAAYPDGEVQSWAQQTREAEALVADRQAPAPLLSAIAAARGLAVTELASRVLAKVQAYAVASGQIIGQRQALEDAISAVDLDAPDAADRLAAIQWPEVSP